MVQTETIKELITNEIFLSLDKDNHRPVKEGEPQQTSLLSALNSLHDLLFEYDRFLARSAGYDCDLTLYMDSLNGSGFNFTLCYSLIPSGQLLLGEGDITDELSRWLIEMHLDLLADMDHFKKDRGLEYLLDRACKKAEILKLDREPYFSLLSTPWQYSRLERRYYRMVDTLKYLNGFLSLKIKKN